MDRLINKKLRASSLIEIIVAMVLLLLTFSLACFIYLNVLRSGNWDLIGVKSKIDEIRNETLISGKFIDESYNLGGTFVRKSFVDYNSDLLVFKITAFNENNKIIFDHSEFIFKR